MTDPLLRISDVYKTYRENKRLVHALNGVSLDIKAGSIFSLLGVNGAGKTTLSSILATLHPLSSGDVFFKGTSIYKNIIEYRRALGFCPQRANLDTYLTVEENLLFAGRYFLMPEHAIQERVAQLLDEFNLHKYASFKIKDLSGGYRQRLLIARSIVHKPKILILDEPTVGLDPHIRRDLWKVIHNLKKHGITVILTTHYLEEAEVLSDTVAMLSKGRVIMQATVDDLKVKYKKNTLEEIFLQLVEEEQR